MPAYLEHLTPKQVARAIGVSDASLKRWCDKGMIASIRTAGGHRRLPLNGVVQFLRETGRQLLRPEILKLPPCTGNGHTVQCRAQVQLREAAQACDDEQFQRLIFDLYLARHSIADVCDRVIAPAFHELGDMWARGELDVYQERRGVEIALRTLHRVYPMLPCVAADAPLALGGTLEGDPYALPTAMVELVLKEAGWCASSYGVGLPVRTLCDAVRKNRPRLVWLSVSTAADQTEFVKQYDELYQAAYRSGVAVVVGGRWLAPETRARMHYSCHCDTLNHLTAFAKTLYNPAPHRPPCFTDQF